ncbi:MULTISPECIES: histidine phosphatase family protein [unclassified Gordonia (in: high G+C Gram-positive bacteria)]|uniref:histidine phosphatase family protein n=1 Tax=unclassified Gordonia (in: high G+C Gram-positive bacteria) TaxID=2657482 RepID=UPI000991394E|nr:MULTISPECIES: histidine phosphatase family protein [unclassified Gordonia (in: high G+C Gram-positive bacteria)]MCX2753415.1 histidine phosphatase family protein [Gordonia sp. 4N]
MTATAEESVPEGDSATKAPSWQGRRSDPTRLILLRHGQTPLSVERRYSGRGNPDLTDEGRRQARAAAARVVREEGIAAIVTSPLRRARSTAEEVAALTGIDVVEHPGLIENDFGDWEGLTFTEASQRDPDLHRAWLSDITVPAPGGESFTQVAERIDATKTELLQKYPGQTVVLVSHVTPIKTLLQDALGVGPELLFRLHLDLASVSIAEYFDDGGSVVRLVNDAAHWRV